MVQIRARRSVLGVRSEPPSFLGTTLMVLTATVTSNSHRRASSGPCSLRSAIETLGNLTPSLALFHVVNYERALPSRDTRHPLRVRGSLNVLFVSSPVLTACDSEQWSALLEIPYLLKTLNPVMCTCQRCSGRDARSAQDTGTLGPRGSYVQESLWLGAQGERESQTQIGLSVTYTFSVFRVWMCLMAIMNAAGRRARARWAWCQCGSGRGFALEGGVCDRAATHVESKRGSNTPLT